VKGRTAAVLAALAASVAVLLAWPKAAVSPEDELRALVAQCVAGVEARDLSAFSAAVAEDFKGQGGLSRAEVKGLVARQALAGGEVVSVLNPSLDVTIEGSTRGHLVGRFLFLRSKARTEDEAKAAVVSAWRIEADCEKRDGRWFFTSARYEQL
jgi:hypothetical protein